MVIVSLFKLWGTLPYIMDQNDYMRYGCVEYPYSCFFCDVLRLLGARRVADLTYGAGSFYRACKSEVHVTGVDIVRHEWSVEPDVFIQDDAFRVVKKLKREYDVAVIDPPYSTKPNPFDEHVKSLYVGDTWNIHRLVQLIKLAKAYTAPAVVVKYLPKEWGELSHLFALQPRHVFVFRHYRTHARPGRLANVATMKNFTLLFVI